MSSPNRPRLCQQRLHPGGRARGGTPGDGGVGGGTGTGPGVPPPHRAPTPVDLGGTGMGPGAGLVPPAAPPAPQREQAGACLFWVPRLPYPRGRGSLHFHCCHYTPEPMMIYGRSRGLCLARASGCIPLHGSCTLVGVPPAGCLRVALFVTERYLWSFRPLTSHYLPALFVLVASCAHVQ